MLNNEELFLLKRIAKEQKNEELNKLIQVQIEKKKKRSERAVELTRQKRKVDKFYARENSRVLDYMKSKHKKIIKNIQKGEIAKAQEIFKEETKVLNKHSTKALYEFLNIFTDKEIEILKNKN